MSKKLKKSLSWLLALCMILSLLPMSVFAASGSATKSGEYVTLDYGTGSANLSITVNVYYNNQQLETFSVNNGARTANQMHISLKDSEQNNYDIETVTINPGGSAILTAEDADAWDLGIWSVTGDPDVTIDVTLCKQFEEPEIEGGVIDTVGVIYYRAYDAQLLKMLYLAGDPNVNEQTDIKSVQIRFVKNYGTSNTWSMIEMPSAAENLHYFYPTAGLSNAGGLGNPNNIRQLEITYEQDGQEKTAIISSGDLLYSNIGGNTYEIKANATGADSTSIVAFYSEDDGLQGIFSLYAVRFVKNNVTLAGNMPKAPEYNNSEYIFANWAYDPNGGDAFLSTTLINGDVDVYAMKMSSWHAGTEIHVLDRENLLLKRFVELYNAQNPTAIIDSTDIDWNNIKIAVNGADNEATNKDYYLNGWKDNGDYYYVNNYNADGALGDTKNTHIPVNEISGITIYAKDVFGNDLNPVFISCGDNRGQLKIEQTEYDHIIDLAIVEAPTKPSDSDLTGNPEDPDDPGILGNITVQCTNTEASHKDQSKEYDALTGSYKVGEVTALANGGYTCDVTVESALYVAKFDEDSGVTHTAKQESKTITLTWDDATGKWVAPKDALPVTFEVECKTPEVTYSVTYIDGAGGTVFGIQKYEGLTNGEATPAFNGTLQRTGYVFAGWEPEVATTVSNDATYTAQWDVDSNNDGIADKNQIHVIYLVDTSKGTVVGDTEQWLTPKAEGPIQLGAPVVTGLEGLYEFTGWTCDNNATVKAQAGYYTLADYKLGETYTLTAEFKAKETPAPETITFVYEAGANGALKGVDSSEITDKVTETVALANGVASPTNVPTPQPDTGYKFVGWKQNSKDDLYTSAELQKMSFSKGTTFTAVFEKKEVPAPDTITFTYKAGVNGDLKNANRFGIVTENVAIRENNTASPTKVPTPLPDTGYKFIGWKQNGKVNLYTSAELKKMSFYKDTTFTAVFEKIDDDQPIVEKRYTIEATAHKGGEISPDGIYKVYKYSDKTYTITADKGYKIYDVVVDGVSVGAVHTYTFERVTEDHTIEVYFAKLPTDPDDSGTSNWLETKDHVAYMTGYPDGTFGPNRNMTRAEVAQMFYALLLNKNVTTTVAFSDVSADAWYAKAVNTLASLGMVSGYPDGTFHPDAPITRAEFATIALAFAYEPLTASCNYNDVPTSAWFYTYVAQATTYGWIGGSNGYFRPNDNITRAEVSVIVNNMLGRAADEDYVDAHAGDLVTFPDVRSSFWAYYSIMETVNDHEYVKLNGLEDWK